MSLLATAITLAGLGLCLTLAVAAWRQQGAGARFLSALLLSIAAQMAGNALLATGTVLRFPHLSQLHTPFAFAIGPLIYAHLRSLTHRRLRGRVLAVHLLPAMAVAILLVPFYLMSATGKAAFLADALQNYPRAWSIRQAVLITQMGTYIAVSMRMRREAVAHAPKLALGWTTPLLRVLPVLWVITAIRFVAAYQASTATYATAAAAVAVGLVISSHLALPKLMPVEERGGDEADECRRRVTALIRDDELFRDRQLTLETLAHRAGTTPHFLSAVINQQVGRSVPDWINGYRVEAVKRALDDPANGQSIQQIAETCGFSSRSAFNSTFRRQTGMTPGVYRARERADS